MVSRIRCCMALNRFCYSLSILVPLGSVYTLITWAWVTFSFSICLWKIGSLLGLSLSLVSSALFLMTTWSYTSAVFTPPGSPRGSDDAQSGEYNVLPQHQPDLPVFKTVTVKDDGSERYCQKCSYRKPDRTHHCRSCQKCVLRMDHHCPWLATCVGFHNYKQFILFLTYVSTWCIFMCIVSGFFVYEFFSINDPSLVQDQFWPVNWIVLVILSGVVGLTVGFFDGWHISLILRNYTTIEYLDEVRFKGDAQRYLLAATPEGVFNIFDIGYRRNWEQIMGKNPWRWWIPVVADSPVDGYTFPISDRAAERLREREALHSFEPLRRPVEPRDELEMRDFRESIESV